MSSEIDAKNDSWTVGRKPVLEMIRANPEQVDIVLVQKDIRSHALSRLVDACQRQGVRFRLVPGRHLDRIHPGQHQGVAARVFLPQRKNLADMLEHAKKASLPLILALDQIQDPGNLGALARTLLAMDGGGIVIPKDRTAALGPAAIKAGAGALHRLDVAQVVNLSRALEQCRESGYHVYGTSIGPDAENVLEFRPHFPAVLVLGNEDRGIRPGVLKRCSVRLFIPMPGTMQSLNVAQAGAVCLGLFARARLLEHIAGA